LHKILPINREVLQRAAAFVSEQADTSEIVIVGPSRGAIDDVVCLACDGALAGVYRYTLRHLVYALSQQAMYARDLIPLHVVPREALATTLGRDTSLDYLRAPAAFPGFARALARTLEDLRLNRLTPARLRQAGRSGPDLAVLLERWNRELRERGFADYAHRVELAIEQAAHAPKRALLAIDLGLRTPAERELIEVLENRAPAMLRLSADRTRSFPTNALTSVQRYALSGEGAPTRAADPSMAFFSASSESLEFVEIARRVLAAGIPFDKVAVLLRNPTRHVPLLQEAFSRAGIPVWFEGGLQRPDSSG
jgi:ATP-dependent helicase/nuclease subunit B